MHKAAYLGEHGRRSCHWDRAPGPIGWSQVHNGVGGPPEEQAKGKSERVGAVNLGDGEYMGGLARGGCGGSASSFI